MNLTLHAVAVSVFACGSLMAAGPAPSAPSAPTGAAAAKSAAVVPAAAVAASSKPASAMTPAELYGGDRLRDPFVDLGVGGGSSRGPLSVNEEEPFSIHALSLRGIMKDKNGDFAILVQTNAGTTYILRGGKLYDRKNKPVAGVTGWVNLKQKKVEVETPDKDVQVLILGEQQEGI